MTIHLTVAIPTFNGASRLPLVLDYLRNQIQVENITWEILVIDNNSTDNLAQVVQNYQSQNLLPVPLIYHFEPRQGLAFARAKAVAEAKGELVGFLDDDTLPNPTWVKAIYTFSQAHPKAGAYGSKIIGKFAIEPPENIRKILFYLALIDRGNQPVQYQPKKNGVPPGAGLVVRRQVWLDSVPQKPLFTGRSQTSVVGSEDEEALLYIHRQGWEIWYNPEMEITHLISAQRLEVSYLSQLLYSVGLTRHYARMLYLPNWQKPVLFWAYFTNDIRKAIAFYLRHHKTFATDPAAACEMQRLLGIVHSPFYIWKRKVSQYLKSS